MSLNTLTTEEHKFINELRSKGFAVIVRTPAELGEDINPSHVEDRSIEFGHQVINDLKD